MKTPPMSYYVINSITMYRLVAAPFLLLLAILGYYDWFKWLVAFSFFTDAIDGPLSRKYKVASIFGSRLDSVADDATVLISAIALWIISPEFIRANWMVVVALLALFAIQMVAALIAYKKFTSFHTYMAKIAAVFQALFFISYFLNLGASHVLFFLAAAVTALQLIEEIILVIVLAQWQANVKGLYWVLRSKHEIVQINKY